MMRRCLPISELARHTVLVMLLFGLLPGMAKATGTSAGVTIANTATVAYSLAGTSNSINSNTVTFRVDEIIDLNLAWQDASNVIVNTPDTNRVLTFRLTNTGNGTDSYSLGVQNNLTGDQFNPVFSDIYLDANGDGVFEPGVDTLYVPGSNDPVLAANASLSIFVRNNIPSGLQSGDIGKSQLTATSKTLSGTPGTAKANAGANGTTAVVGTSGGVASAIGAYQVTGAVVSLVKSVVINDPNGGNQPVTGATLTYSIAVSVTGAGTANGVVITDPIPANTTYTSGSLSLNGTPLTDSVDSDAGDVGGTTANTVTVKLGNLTATSPVQTIRFKVIIN